ncbi:alcohol dehydrogenase 1, putative [Trichomonas vaginalis G3]|uniref:Alcohol dehydrogenase 1, putative n=2 Tax=Trichomonas vaginalis TaxID=5722 RepID=A2DJ40_TRIV3|nr:alcohol dehydrogenase 1 [Trichomonas vaginalis G3]EAY19615.1 alcohol dehydrogenase 1, putative [Trichomonas vaginalis G3]KAI5515055.1 alcohol dehydrogenase 1 [Trichomonas vaginalis G3]|eukprot:XP_001580601.1 alcohol dehydrogenase 1 [Trichomonas vaginalis G3]
MTFELPKTMKAFAMRKIGEVGWIEKPVPECGPNDAICRPLALAPCTSDIHTVWAGAIGERHDMILGHEAVGQVVKIGSEVKNLKVGDKVLVPAVTPDWGSEAAQEGFPAHSGGMLGGWKFSNFKDGVFAEYFHVNEADANLAKLPEGLTPRDVIMCSDMMTTGFHGAELAEVKLGDIVVVIGIGPVGLMSVRGAALMGASRIFAVGSRPHCCDTAVQYGATDIINYKNGDIVEQILKATGGKGVDRVIIAGGDVHTFAQAIKMIRAGGVIGNVNYLGEGEMIDVPRVEWGVGMGHKFIHGGLTPGGALRMEKMANLIKYKKVDPTKLITHEFKGLEKVEDALMLMKDKPVDLIKPVVLIEYNDKL